MFITGGRATTKVKDDNSDDDSRANESNARVKNETHNLIQKQFALRKFQASKEADMMPSAQLTRVKAASHSGVKVAGLNNTIRESYLKMIADLFKENYLQMKSIDPPDHELVYKDFEDCGIEIEYNCFSRNTNLSLYRRSCAIEITQIKKETKENRLCTQLKHHVPKKRNVTGGDHKDYERKLKELVGGTEFKKASELVSSSIRKSGMKKDPLKQKTLGSYFTKSGKSDESVSSSKNDIQLNDVESSTFEVPQETTDGNSAQTDEEEVESMPAIATLINSLKSGNTSEVGTDNKKSDDIETEKIRKEMAAENEKIRKEIEADRLKIQQLEEKMSKVKYRSESKSKDKKRHRSRSKERSNKSKSSHDKHSKSHEKRSRRSPSKHKSSHRDKQESHKSSDKKLKHDVLDKNVSSSSTIVTQEPISSTPVTIKLERQSVSPTPTIIKTERRSVSPAPTVIKTERRSVSPVLPVIKGERRSVSPSAQTVINYVHSSVPNRRQRSNSREHDFDDIIMEQNVDFVKMESDPTSNKKRTHQSFVERDVKNVKQISSAEAKQKLVKEAVVKHIKAEPRSQSPDSSVSKHRSNSRERDFDDVHMEQNLGIVKTELGTTSNKKRARHSSVERNDNSSTHNSSAAKQKLVKEAVVIRIKAEPRSPSPTDTIIYDLQHTKNISKAKRSSRSNSREIDLDELSADSFESIPPVNVNKELQNHNDTLSDISGSPLPNIKEEVDYDHNDALSNISSSPLRTIKKRNRSRSNESNYLKKKTKYEEKSNDDLFFEDKSPEKEFILDSDSDWETGEIEKSKLNVTVKKTNETKIKDSEPSTSRTFNNGNQSDDSANYVLSKSSKPVSKDSKYSRPSRSNQFDTNVGHESDDSAYYVLPKSAKPKKDTKYGGPSRTRKFDTDRDGQESDDSVNYTHLKSETNIYKRPEEKGNEFEEMAKRAREKILEEKERQLAEVERLIAMKTREKALSKVETKIAVEEARIVEEREDFVQQLFGTDNIDHFDDDEALSNVSAAQELRKRRLELEAANPNRRRFLIDQLYGIEVEKLENPNNMPAERKAIVLKETDYENMKINGRITELQQRFKDRAMPRALSKRIKDHKAMISDNVVKHLMPYYNAERIQPKFLFRELARKISHIFYDQSSGRSFKTFLFCSSKNPIFFFFVDEDSIQKHIDDIFVRLPCVNSLSDVEFSKFL